MRAIALVGMLLLSACAVLSAGSVLSGCSGGSGGDAGAVPGSTRMCKGEERVMLDCSSEVSYQGTSGEAEIKVMDVAGAKGAFEEKALRRVDTQVEQFVAAQTRACRDYNACVMPTEDYRAETKQYRERMQLLPTLMTALKSAKTERERVKVLDRLYRGVVPEEKRVEEVTFQMGMIAEIPEDLGGGTFSVAPGGAVPTNARVHFRVRASKQAYLYIFQTTPKGEINVLFPDPRIGTTNPLPGGIGARIPGGDKPFRVNEKDIGTENVYIVVSAKPVSNIDAALTKVKSGDVSAVSQNALLQQVASVKPPAQASNCNARALELDDPSPQGCTRSRGLELDDDSAEPLQGVQGAPPAMQMRPAPGDDLIVTVFPFEHLGAAAYKSAGGTAAKAHRSRGIVVED